jgi:hypothetical protein
LVLLVFAFLVIAVLRPRLLRLPSLTEAYARAPALRPGLLALLVLLTLGSLLNDSGSAVSAVAAALAVPLVVATAAKVAAERADPRQSRAPHAELVVEPDSAPANPVAPGRGSSGEVSGHAVEPLR